MKPARPIWLIARREARARARSKAFLASTAVTVLLLGVVVVVAAIADSVEQQKARPRAHLEELDTLFASLQSRAFQGEL